MLKLLSFRREGRGDKRSLGLSLIAEGREPIVDIVAIHGLNGDSKKTWTADNGANWISQFLPEDLPNARIFSYGYEAKTHDNAPICELSFDDHAQELVGDLCRERESTETTERSIIFIAHSLGGIVVKSALVHSNARLKDDEKDPRGSIVQKTHGIFFMGTPHQGGLGADIAQVILKVAGVFMQTNDAHLKVLVPGSEELRGLNKEYFAVAKRWGFDTKLCYEDRKTQVLRNGPAKWIVPKPNATMPLPNSITMAINADHRCMVRYREKEGSNYRKVLACLKLVIKSIAKKHQTNQVASKGWSVKFDKWKLPIRQCFVGREKELEQIHQKLQEQVERSVVVLHGLGGVGKTQLAARYAVAHREDYDAVFWLYSKDVDVLERSFVNVAHRISEEHPSFFTRFLHLVHEQNGSPDQDIDEANGQSVEIRKAAVEEVNLFLSQDANTQWLLIFDNYNTPNVGADRNNPAAFSIRSFFPYADHGNIIVTSTSSGHDANGHQQQLIPIKKLQDTKESLLILSHNSGRSNLDQDPDAWKLAKKLDGLPLALTSAGAYLRHNGMSFGKYLELYNEAWSKMQAHAPRLEHYDGTLWTTWKLALDQVEEANPNSKELFLLWGYFDNQDIWWEMIQAGRDDTQPDWFRNITEDELEFENAMGHLCEYNLAEPNPASLPRNGGSQGYSMHACVHDWTKYGLNKDRTIVHENKESEMARLAFSCIAKLMPRKNVPKFWTVQQRLAKHVDECLQIIRRLPTENDDASMADSLHEIGVFYYGEQNLDMAKELFERALGARERLFGVDHDETLKTVTNLGEAYRRKGDLSKAREMLDRALTGKMKTLGPDNEYTLRTYLLLGLLCRAENNPTEEGNMLRHALEGFERTLGWEHHSTLTAADSLAAFYQSQNDPTKAAALFDRAWRGLSSLLGTGHPAVLSCLRALGDVYTELCKFDKAEECYCLALKSSEQIRDFKKTSTRALEIWRSLITMYQRWGKPNEGDSSCRRAVEWFKQVFGPDHPSTFAACIDLGMFLRWQALGSSEAQNQTRKLTKASEMCQWALEGYERTLGPDHVSTLNAIVNLGLLFTAQGGHAAVHGQYRGRKFAEALEMYQRALDGYDRTCGRNTESALRVLSNMGNVHLMKQELDEARSLLEEALEGYGRTCGRDNELAIWTLQKVGETYMLRDDMLDKAEESFKKALEGYERTCGRDKQPALWTLFKLGETYMLMGDLSQAQEQLEEALEGYEQKFGKEDFATLRIAVRLWDVHSRQGNLETAKSYAGRVPLWMLQGFGENGTPRPSGPKLICAP